MVGHLADTDTLNVTGPPTTITKLGGKMHRIAILLLLWSPLGNARAGHTQIRTSEANAENLVHLRRHWVLPGNLTVDADSATDASGVTRLGGDDSSSGDGKKKQTRLYHFTDKKPQTPQAKSTGSSSFAAKTADGNVLVNINPDGSVTAGPCNGDNSSTQSGKGLYDESGKELTGGAQEAMSRMNASPSLPVFMRTANGIMVALNRGGGSDGGGGGG